MAGSRHQFALVQLFLAFTAFGFALAAIRTTGLACYALGSFAALLAGASMFEHHKYAGFVAFVVLLGIYAIRLALA